MAKIFDRMKDLMFGEYEDDEDDFYEDDDIWMRRQDLPERGTPIPPDMACVIRNIPRLRRENHLRLGTGIILRFIASTRMCRCRWS